jgi:competence protein ComEC
LVLASMVFGVAATGGAAQALLDARTAGVAWAIATSGLHLAAIVLLADRVGSLVGLGRRGRAALVLGALLVTTLAAGLKLSLVRAAFVASATVLARLIGRRRDASAVLGAVIAAIVLTDPAAAYDVGLALGALAVGTLVVFAGLARAWLRPLVGRRVSGALGASVAAQAGVAPLVAALFGGVALLGPIVLVLSGPVVAGAVMFGFAGAGVLPVARAPGETLLRFGSLAADAAARIWAAAAGVTGAFVPTAGVPWWAWVAWAALGAGLWLRWPLPKRAARVRAGGAALLVVLSLVSLRPPMVQTGVVVMDIGQGDAVLIRDGGHAVLVDTGPDPTVLRQALARAGVHALEGLVLTHAHADHTGGLDGLQGVARPAWIGVPDVVDGAVDALARTCANRTDAVVRLRRDMTFTVGSTTVRVLWPQGGERMLAANDTSVVLLVEHARHRALLLGDAEERAQRGVLEAWSRPVEMLKVAHHGSTNGSIPTALAAWRPPLALISVGAGNSFGHPHAAALSALADIGAVVRRTDRDGDLAWDSNADVVAAPQSAASLRPKAPATSPVLCDNRCAGVPAGLPTARDTRTSAWPRPTCPISSPSTSSTAPSSCCWSVPRNGCATGWPRWPTWTSTWRPSTGIPPPSRTCSTPPTPCPS